MRSFKPSFKLLKTGLLLSATLLLSAAPALAADFGDANGDGVFDVGDATFTLRIAVEVVQPTPEQVRSADVSPTNGDGTFGDHRVNVTDAIRMLQRIVGIDTAEPWPGTRSVHDDEPLPTGGVPLPKTFLQAITADTTKEFKLDGGFKLQGKLNGGNGTQSLRFLDPVQNISISGSPNATGAYTVGVPAGTYHAYVTFSKQSGMFGSTSVTVPTGESVTVTADTTRDFTLPAQPQLFTVQGTIAAPEGVEPPFSFIIQQTKTATGGDITDNVGAIASSFTMDGTYSVELPAGTYRARFHLTGGDGGFTGVDAEETFTVVGNMTQNLTAPQLVTLSGSVTTADTLTVGTSMVSAIGSGNLNFGSSQVEEGAYGVSMPKGTYLLNFIHSFDEAGEQEGPQESFSYQLGNLNLQADTEKDIVVPALPAPRVTLTGTVVGPEGAPITDGSVFLTGSNLTNADPLLSYSVSLDLSANGTFVISVPPGQYRIFLSPDPGFPVVNKPDVE